MGRSITNEPSIVVLNLATSSIQRSLCFSIRNATAIVAEQPRRLWLLAHGRWFPTNGWLNAWSNAGHESYGRHANEYDDTPTTTTSGRPKSIRRPSPNDATAAICPARTAATTTTTSTVAAKLT